MDDRNKKGLCKFWDSCELYDCSSITCKCGPHNYCGKYKAMLCKLLG